MNYMALPRVVAVVSFSDLSIM